MRKKYPKPGDKRTITCFLYFPVTINYEKRWWEDATWEETFKWDWTKGKETFQATRWIDNNKEEK